MSEQDNPYHTPQKQGDPAVAHAGSCIKVLLVWISPLLVVPLLGVISGGAWPLGVLLAIGFLVWMGRISARDSSGRPGYDIKPHPGRVVLYVVFQLIWIPLFWAAIVWGFCAATGSGTFK